MSALGILGLGATGDIQFLFFNLTEGANAPFSSTGYSMGRIAFGNSNGDSLAKLPFAPVSPEVSEPFGFDFLYQLPTGDSIDVVNSFTCAVAATSPKNDPAAAAIVKTAPVAPWISGTRALAVCSGFLDGVTYVLRAEITTTLGYSLALSQYITGQEPT